MQSMTPRQWKLYCLIRDSKNPPLTQHDICMALPNDYIYHERNNDCCPLIWQDVDFINGTYEVEKIIVVDRFTYRLGTKAECQDYADKLQIGALKKLKRYWAVVNKMEMDGQGKLVSAHDKIIDEKSRARHFVESFVSKALNDTEDEPNNAPEPQEPPIQAKAEDEKIQRYDIWGNKTLY